MDQVFAVVVEGEENGLIMWKNEEEKTLKA